MKLVIICSHPVLIDSMTKINVVGQVLWAYSQDLVLQSFSS